jgi:hypothetical protein
MTPSEMLNIFRNNIVVVRGIPTSDPGGQDYLKITQKTNAVGEARRNNTTISVPVMQVERANSTDKGAFLTWIVDYAQNDIKYKTLSSARSFCFTATMNGCTFGIGSQAPNGVVTVSHANAIAVGSTGGMKNQTERQSQMAVRSDDALNFDANQYDVGVVSGMALNTTLIGIYDTGEWSFYYQTYANTGLTYVIRTFRKIDVNNLRA